MKNNQCTVLLGLLAFVLIGSQLYLQWVVLDTTATSGMPWTSLMGYGLLAISIVLIGRIWRAVFRPLVTKQSDQDAYSQHLLHMINEVEDHAIILLDKEGNVTQWNRGAQRIKGYTTEEAIGGSFGRFYTTEDRKNGRPQEMLALALAHNVANDEGWRVRKDGSRFWASVSIMAIRGEEGELIGYGKITRDLTDKKRAERTVLLEARNKELEQFNYIASHDLQEPLRTISSYILVLNEDFANDLPVEAVRYLKAMDRASVRMQVLVRTLLDYSRLGRDSSLELHDCRKLAEEALENLQSLIEQTQTTIVLGKLPTAEVYPVEMRQLMQNLIGNAIKFRKKSTPPIIHVDCISKGKKWQFSLKDNGIGMEESLSEKIFQIFQRGHDPREYQGDGIGLAYSKKIVELHEGRIWVNSTVGEGSTFYFTISKNLL